MKNRVLLIVSALLLLVVMATACAAENAPAAEPVAVATPEPTPTPTPEPDPCADCSSCNCDDADCCVPPCCDSPYCMPGCDKRNCCDDCLEAFRARSRERDELWAAEQQARQDAWDAMSEDERLEILQEQYNEQWSDFHAWQAELYETQSERGKELMDAGYYYLPSNGWYSENMRFFTEGDSDPHSQEWLELILRGMLIYIRYDPEDFYCVDGMFFPKRMVPTGLSPTEITGEELSVDLWIDGTMMMGDWSHFRRSATENERQRWIGARSLCPRALDP